ncbi:MAG: TetR/AcrR family transcriptional regulator [Chloroflexi bacterium]|nr:TetR/AcrR family transcriptional regulator [Chloroflexota bacterium]
MELLGEKPLQSITVRDIAERAGVNRATFYAHFVDKYDLFGHVIREIYRAELIAHLPDTTTFCVTHLRTLIVATHEFMQRFKSGCAPADHEFKPLIEAQVQNELFNTLLMWLDAQPALQLPSSAQNTAVMMSWAIFGAALQWQPVAPDPEQLADQVIAFLTGSLRGTGDVAHAAVVHDSR